MPDGLSLDLLEHSVTAADAGEYKGGGVVTFLIPWFMMGAANLPLPADLPPYWTLNLGIARYWSRDMILRSTILHEDFWSGALAKVSSKQAAKSFDVQGRGKDRYQEMLLQWGGDGYVPAQERGMLDYLCTNNGEFWEIVRQNGAQGSRILGLVHLDSLRCIRTGDPDIPVVFVDLKGAYHSLKYYQVMALVDQPDPSSASLGIGHCAAERAYHRIYTQSAIEQYLREKVTGTGANVIDFVHGLNSKQIEEMLRTARAESESRGMSYYQGHIIQGLLAQTEPKIVSINLRDLPDGFDREKETEISQLVYANAIGMDVQDINPRILAHGSFGTSTQAAMLDEKQHGYGPAARDKQLTHLLNHWVLPGKVTFSFSERDLREEQSKVAVQATREQWLNSKVLNGQLTPQQALQISIEANDVPREFLQAPMMDESQPLSDEEKPVEETMGQDGAMMTTPASPTLPAPPPSPTALTPRQSQVTKVKEQTILDLTASIQAAREALIMEQRVDEREDRFIAKLKEIFKRPEKPPEIIVNVEPTPIKVNVQSPQINVQPPQVNVQVMPKINVKPTPIENTITLPDKTTRREIKRNAQGLITEIVDKNE